MIRDRGKLKWSAAAFLPEQSAMMRKMWAADRKVDKPIMDEYQIEEMEDKIHYAMEYNPTSQSYTDFNIYTLKLFLLTFHFISKGTLYIRFIELLVILFR